MHAVQTMEPKSDIILGGSTSIQDEAEVEENESLVEYTGQGMTVTVLEDGDQDQDVEAEDDEEETEAIPIEKLPLQFQKVTLKLFCKQT